MAAPEIPPNIDTIGSLIGAALLGIAYAVQRYWKGKNRSEDSAKLVLERATVADTAPFSRDLRDIKDLLKSVNENLRAILELTEEAHEQRDVDRRVDAEVERRLGLTRKPRLREE